VDWLKQNSYLAEWLAIPVAIAIAYITVKDKSLPQVNWSMLLINVTFVVSLAVALTEGHSESVHGFAVGIAAFTLGALIVASNRR